jgi:hypothetical protein
MLKSKALSCLAAAAAHMKMLAAIENDRRQQQSISHAFKGILTSFRDATSRGQSPIRGQNNGQAFARSSSNAPHCT